MLELTFGEQVKIILSRKGMTIKELAEKIEKQTGKKMSRQNLTQRLGRDNFQEQDMRMIAKILECPFYLDILEEHEDRTEKPVKEQKEASTRAEERDITIGELVDIHKELDAIEKKKSKKKAKKVVEENPEYVQETIFDFFVNEKAEEPEVEEEPEIEEEPVYEPEPEEEQVEEPAIEIEEEPAYEEAEPEYAEEPAYEEAEPEYAEEPVYEEAEPEVEAEPVYEEAEPEYAEEPVYEEAEPEYAEEPAYEEAEPEYAEEPAYEEAEPEYEEEPVTEPEVEEPEPKKTETEKKAHGWRAFFGIHKKHEEPVKEEKEEEKPEIQYHEFDYSEDGESGELAEEFLPDEPEEAETETAAYENAEQLNTNYDAGHQNRYAQENEEDLFTSTEEDLEKGELNPYTGHEYESNSVRMHPNRIGYVQVYDRGTHQWTDMTEWAFLGYQERKKALLGKDYEPPIYLD